MPRCTAASAVAMPILPVMPFTITGNGSAAAAALHARRSLRPATVHCGQRCAVVPLAPREARVRTLGCSGVRNDRLQLRCIATAERSWSREPGGKVDSQVGPSAAVIACR